MRLFFELSVLLWFFVLPSHLEHRFSSHFSCSRLGVSLFRPSVVNQLGSFSVSRQDRGATSSKAHAVASTESEAVNSSQQSGQLPVPVAKRPYSPFQPNNKAEFVMARVDDLMAWARKVR